MTRRLPRIAERAMGWLSLAGVSLHQAATLRRAPRFWGELQAYRAQAIGTTFAPGLKDLMPTLTDYTAPAGIARGHYFHQDLWAARRIFARHPAHHVDVGSRIDGFVAHVLTFMPITVIDIRPMDSSVEGLTFAQGDATDLRSIASDTIESLSSLHAVEHIGLGRYGDPIDANGWRAAIREFTRVLAPGGFLYFSVPVGRERVEFNSHRVFAPQTILDAFIALRLVAFHAVDDHDDLLLNVTPAQFADARFACGLFEFTKD
jgi:SAM-dependent methyltransferase